jgi:hypothetical protein
MADFQEMRERRGKIVRAGAAISARGNPVRFYLL